MKDRSENGQKASVGKRAATESELAVEATEYVERRLTVPGGIREGLQGFWHKTLPVWVGGFRALSALAILGLLMRVLFTILAAVIPVFGRRAVSPQFVHATLTDTITGTFHNFSPIDYLLAVTGVLVYGVPKWIDAISRSKAVEVHRPFTDLAAAIKEVPRLAPKGDTSPALRLALTALRMEMSQLVDDPSSPDVTEVTLLQYCDSSGQMMQVTARTNVNERTHFPISARRFLANYVARAGRWYAEHDFRNKHNPFKLKRLTVPGSPPVTYRSVLYMPITTVKVAHRIPNFAGPEPRSVDCCIGVICVHTTQPFRFWRWGDHRKAGGGGFGNVAMQRALPYISLVRKLIEDTACSVELEDGHE